MYLTRAHIWIIIPIIIVITFNQDQNNFQRDFDYQCHPIHKQWYNHPDIGDHDYQDDEDHVDDHDDDHDDRHNHHADDDDDDDDLKEGKEIPRALLGQTFSTLFSIAAYSTCGC